MREVFTDNRWINVAAMVVILMMTFVTSGQTADVELSWQPNSEDDLSGYRLYYGTQSRTYPHTQDVQNQTSHVLSGLDEGVEYFFSVTAYDANGNESSYSKEVSFVLGDQQAPTLVSVVPLDSKHLQVRFSEPVEPSSAETAGNYQIENGLAVNSAVLQNDNKTVHLTTAEHTAGTDYTLVVNGIRDRAVPPNEIAADSRVSYSVNGNSDDTTPPTIILASLSSSTQLVIRFSEPVDVAAATQTQHYQVDNGIEIVAAEMDGDNGVQLTTSEHVAGVVYQLTVNEVTDRAQPANEISANARYDYTYEPGDILGPMIQLVTVIDKNRLRILFNEPIDAGPAEQIQNYQIDGGIQITSVSLDGTGQIVTLETSEHQADTQYILRVRNVTDTSTNHNPIAEDASYAYVYTPLDRTGPTIRRVDVIDDTHLVVSFSEPVDPTSAETAENYQISNDVHVLSATMDGTGMAVELFTTPHQRGQIYLLRISEVRDRSELENEIIPNSAYTYAFGGKSTALGPTIVQLTVENETSLLVQFSQKLESESAENPDHYTLNRDAVVYSAQLDESATRVRLTTSAHKANSIYVLTVNKVRDITTNTPIATNSTYTYSYSGPDHVGPLITMVNVIDSRHMDILFNETVDRGEAEKVSHYEISGDVGVQEVRLSGSRQVAHLTTDEHVPNKLYLLRVSGIVDESPARNEIDPNTSYSYTFEPDDQVAPTIAMVRIKDATHLQVVFSEPIRSSDAMDPSRYTLNNSTQVLSARPDGADHLVELETTPLYVGQLYILMINGVADRVGNSIVGNAAYTFVYGSFSVENGPRITGVQSLDAEQIRISFDQPVDPASAQTATHYQIQTGVDVYGAQLDSTGQAVVLTTSAHVPSRIYVILVQGVGLKDNPSQTIAPGTPFFYMYGQQDISAPTISKVRMLGDMALEVTFSRMVDRLSAENRQNYLISNGVVVLSAEVGLSGTKVVLETSRHQPGVAYTIQSSKIFSRDRRYQLETSSSSFAYTYLPNLQVSVEGGVETSLSYLDVGKHYYIDRNYVITSAPNELKRVRMLMTSNNDRMSTVSRYMALKLSQPAFVYIAFDSRATSVPNWLEARFSKTGYQIGVSDNARMLDVWQGFFEYGTVLLGGNQASGSVAAQSMYLVLIQEPDFSQLSDRSKLDDAFGKGGVIPETVMLHDNYPNPFNPQTSIGFELPYDMEVKLLIYNILGQTVQTVYNTHLTAGQHLAIWDGRNQEGVPVAAGMYFYRLEAWEQTERNNLPVKENQIILTKKMLLVK